ncbi:MAG: M20/M25/M40 family metallo-hydrolase, partial [Clostridiales bacterium]|nr:M20/M25/M40 family metallo-hydrolase [Clostridiales bacterium]
VFTVGCAGGATARCVLPVTRTACAGHAMTVTVSGLRGGHSGSEIHKGRGNASILLGRILSRAGDIRLVSADGGMFDNAITREVSATVITGDPDSLQALCTQMDADFRGELRATDPDVAVTCVPCREVPDLPMDGESTRRCVCLLTCVPNGVQVMSADMPGLVQTSLNLGILATGRNSMEVSFSVRSSVESQKNMLLDRLECLTAQLGGSVDVTGNYPGWEYAPESPLRELMVEVYREQYGCEPEVGAIHAGLECGLFAGKIPGLDSVSFGPDLSDVHTCHERLHIASTQRTWKLLCEVLRRMK